MLLQGSEIHAVCILCDRDSELMSRKKVLKGILHEYNRYYNKYLDIETDITFDTESVYRSFSCQYRDICEKYLDILESISKYEVNLCKLCEYLISIKSDEILNVISELREYYPILCDTIEMHSEGYAV